MSRFNNLEFGEEFDGNLESQAERQPARQKAQLKDEHYYLTEAQMAFHSGRFEHALRSYSRVLEYNALSLDAWAGQVRMLIELKQFDQAKQWADQALERFPNEPELLAAKAVALARLGDLKAALAYSDASIESGGAEQPYVWLARGDVQLAQHEKRATFSFEKAFALAPGSWLIRWLAARVHFYYRKFAVALKEVQEALELDAAHGVLWLQLGLCQHALGLVGPARCSIQQARELLPDNTEADDAWRELFRSGVWARFRGRYLRWLTG